jgi:hypothetical protein
METVSVMLTDYTGLPHGFMDLRVHDKKNCAGRHCVIHNPSDHPLNKALKNWRADTKVMERICKHGIGHNDPDDIAYRVSQGENPETAATHGCDGCCTAK